MKTYKKYSFLLSTLLCISIMNIQGMRPAMLPILPLQRFLLPVVQGCYDRRWYILYRNGDMLLLTNQPLYQDNNGFWVDEIQTMLLPPPTEQTIQNIFYQAPGSNTHFYQQPAPVTVPPQQPAREDTTTPLHEYPEPTAKSLLNDFSGKYEEYLNETTKALTNGSKDAIKAVFNRLHTEYKKQTNYNEYTGKYHVLLMQLWEQCEITEARHLDVKALTNTAGGLKIGGTIRFVTEK